MSKGAQLELVLGCAERPAVAAGAVAATAVSALLESSDEDAGSRGLVEWFEPLATLRQLRMHGLRPEIFGGARETY